MYEAIHDDKSIALNIDQQSLYTLLAAGAS